MKLFSFYQILYTQHVIEGDEKVLQISGTLKEGNFIIKKHAIRDMNLIVENFTKGEWKVTERDEDSATLTKENKCINVRIIKSRLYL